MPILWPHIPCGIRLISPKIVSNFFIVTFFKQLMNLFYGRRIIIVTTNARIIRIRSCYLWQAIINFY